MSEIDSSLSDEITRAIKQDSPVYLTGEQFEATFETRIVSVSEGKLTLVNKVPYTMITQVMNASYSSLQLGQSRLFSQTKLESDGVNLIFKIEKGEKYGETRGDERFPFSAKESVHCQFNNPFDPPTVLKKRVIDMSAGGLSLVSRRGTKLFSSNSTIPQVEILVDGKTYRKTDAQVVYQRQLLDLSGRAFDQIGLKFI